MTIRRLVLAGCLAIGGSVALTAQSPLTVLWDYPDTALVGVAEFQVAVDGGAYQSVGLPSPQTLPDTQSGHKSFASLLPLIGAGTHTVTVRACNSTECSWDAAVVFKLIGPASNVRIKK